MNTQQAISKLDNYVRARYPIIAIVSHEETRVLKSIKAMAANGKTERKVAEWAVTKGLTGLDGLVEPDETKDPIAMLMAVESFAGQLEKPVLFVVKDINGWLNDPVAIRQIRDVAAALEKTPHSMIFLSPTFTVPGDLEKTIVIIDWPLPDQAELEAILSKVTHSLPSYVKVTINGGREKVVKSLMGLTAFEAEGVILNAVAATGSLSDDVINLIVKEKAQIIRKSGVLEFYDTSLTPADVGGLRNLKEYAEVKLSTYSDKAKEFGIDPARGVLLVGVPGTGKSLTAKAIAGGKMPLLRLDVGALMGSLVGQSESNMRNALKVAEAISPCVLWLDEIEKGLGGVSGGESDGGTTKRVFGTFLTWMAEKTAMVYVIATANDIRALPAELFRAGRFDDIFFVDLPNYQDRMQILGVHLHKRGRTAENIKADHLKEIIKVTWGMTGAEIEKTVTGAIERAFFEGRDLTGNDLIEAAKKVIPISKTMKDQIATLRSWAQTRAQVAGDPLEAEPKFEGLRTVDL